MNTHRLVRNSLIVLLSAVLAGGATVALPASAQADTGQTAQPALSVTASCNPSTVVLNRQQKEVPLCSTDTFDVSTYMGVSLTLGTTGGAGTGAVTFSLWSNSPATNCHLTDTAPYVLTSDHVSLGGGCYVIATKAGDDTYAPVSTPPINIDIHPGFQNPYFDGVLYHQYPLGISGNLVSLPNGPSSAQTQWSALPATDAVNRADGCQIVNGNEFTDSATSAGVCLLGGYNPGDRDWQPWHDYNDVFMQTRLIIYNTGGYFGTPLGMYVSYTTGYGAITYTAVDGTAQGCTMSGRFLTSTTPGTCIVTAHQAADTRLGDIAQDSDPATITLIQQGVAPTYTSASTATTTVRSPFSTTVTTTGTPTAALSLGSDAPSWLSLADNGDGTATISGTPPSGSVGTYPFTVHATNTAGTTDQTFTLTVAAVPLTVTASSGTMTYGGTVPTITPSYSGFLPGDGASVLTTAPTCTTVATPQSPVGNYGSSCSGGAATDYTLGDVAGSVQVTPAPLTVTGVNAQRYYSAANPALTAALTGFVNGDSLATSGVTGAATCTTTASVSSMPGSYPITCSIGTLAATNYAFGSFVAGTLTVQRAPTVISAVNSTSGPVMTFSGTLTALGAPLARQTLTFSLNGHKMCTGTTAANGTATCKVLGLRLGLATTTAAYAGSSLYLGASTSITRGPGR